MSRTMKTIGTRAQVWHGTAKRTSGGLTKGELFMNKAGRIVSRAKHLSAKKEQRLKKYGFGPKSRKEMMKLSRKSHRRSHKRRGHRGGTGPILRAIGEQIMWNHGKSPMPKTGGSGLGALNPASVDASDITGQGIAGAGVTDFGSSSTDVQMRAGLTGGRRRRHRGGMPALSPADVNGSGIAGAGVTDFGSSSTDVQMRAGLTGGRRRRMRGGTTKISLNPMDINDPMNRALMA